MSEPEPEEKKRNPNIVLLQDIAISIGIVAIIGIILFGVAGVWPPMVAIESGSMEPNMYAGDLVFVVDNERYVPDGVETQHGIVTKQIAEENNYEKFGNYGDVIIFNPDGQPGNAIIHRAIKYVEKGETWERQRGNGEITAEHSGFITKGDNNRAIDQEDGISQVVKPEWVQGKAYFRIPYLGNIRLLFPLFQSGTKNVINLPGVSIVLV